MAKVGISTSKVIIRLEINESESKLLHKALHLILSKVKLNENDYNVLHGIYEQVKGINDQIIGTGNLNKRQDSVTEEDTEEDTEEEEGDVEEELSSEMFNGSEVAIPESWRELCNVPTNQLGDLADFLGLLKGSGKRQIAEYLEIKIPKVAKSNIVNKEIKKKTKKIKQNIPYVDPRSKLRGPVGKLEKHPGNNSVNW